MDIQKMVDAIAEQGCRDRANYHATFGDLIDKLKNAEDGVKFNSDGIIGVSAYRGYYSDIALCTDYDGFRAFKNNDDYESKFESYKLPENPKELAKILESLIGSYFDGYKGGMFEITREKPLWVAEDRGDCSSIAVVEITDDLKLITKIID